MYAADASPGQIHAHARCVLLFHYCDFAFTVHVRAHDPHQFDLEVCAFEDSVSAGVSLPFDCDTSIGHGIDRDRAPLGFYFHASAGQVRVHGHAVHESYLFVAMQPSSIATPLLFINCGSVHHTNNYGCQVELFTVILL